MEPKRVPQHRVKIDLGVIAMKEYVILHKAPEPKPHHQKKFRVILNN